MAITALENDGVRQWEGWHPIYEMENQIPVWNHQSVLVGWKRFPYYGLSSSPVNQVVIN